jgi:hypothetical protein
VGHEEERSGVQTAPGWQSSRVHKVPDRLVTLLNAEIESVTVLKLYEEAMAPVHSVQVVACNGGRIKEP